MTETKYIALLQSMRDIVALIVLLGESTGVLPIITEKAKFHCTVFEDNTNCIELVKLPRMRPRIKHIGPKCHHFRFKVKGKIMSAHRIDTKMQY